VFGFPIAGLADDDAASEVAAALFGEGMSSPLMDALRERSALVYYAACSADRTPWSGQFTIEASTAPRHLDELVAEVARLLVEQTRASDPVALERARNQLAVRRVQALERPARLLEEAALDLFVRGRVRSRAELAARVDAVGADDLRRAFRSMLAHVPAVAVAGRIGKGLQAGQRFGELIAAGR
jgi:predicted Zn-dependent peptidase